MTKLESQQEAIEEFYRRQELLDGAVMDEDDARKREMRKASLRTIQYFMSALRLLAQYEGNRSMALDCFLFALGEGQMIGCESAVQIAEKHFSNPKKKAAVSKCIARFRDCLMIKNMPGQRPEEGRKKMTRARIDQIQTP